MSKDLRDFLSEERIKTVAAVLVCREIMVRVHNSLYETKEKEGRIYRFKEPYNKSINYLTDRGALCPSVIHYDEGFSLSYSIRIDNDIDRYRIEGLLLRKESGGKANIISSFSSKIHWLTMYGTNKNRGIPTDDLDTIANELAADFINNCTSDINDLKWLCYTHLLNSISKRTKMVEPVGYITGIFCNDILTRINIRTIKKKIRYKEQGEYLVYDKIRFRISGEPGDKDEIFDYIEETTDVSPKWEYKVHDNEEWGLTYITDQPYLIKNGLKRILGLN